MDLCTYRRKFKFIHPITIMREFYRDSNRKSSNAEIKTKSPDKSREFRSLLGSKCCFAEKFSTIIMAHTPRENPVYEAVCRSKSSKDHMNDKENRFPSESPLCARKRLRCEKGGLGIRTPN